MNRFAVIDATWPPARFETLGPVTLRHGAGGGKRVSAASAPDDVAEADLDAALGRTDLFQIQGAQPRLDSLLDARGFRIVDPVVILEGDAAVVAGPGPDKVSAFEVWPPLAIQREIWAAGGIGAPRLAIMDRAQGPKLSLLGRVRNQPAGTAFVAMHGTTAMVHAVEVLARHRGLGCARNMMRGAAQWAVRQGATRFAALTLRENAPAIALYASLGMVAVEHYHYRLRPS